MERSPRRERKVVTVVFCDLVGFTAQAEEMDPEDVEAFLGPYHERVRSELERHGGTVEKFIGDAVMALFGAPAAHEDDPERAVRAALAIRDWAVEHGEVQVRIAATTGEALIRLDARPETGVGMASGDVVNTAARLQAAAPVNGILADETTYRATRHVIGYEAAAPVEAKGKPDPIPVWKAGAARSRFGVDVAHEARAELVGRERELAALREAYARARHDRAPQLVTLVGVPGIGKSRLVYELSRIADADPELITWRQGRCLAYGDGVTLWALGEIVKAQAGILEQDTPDEVRAKVVRTVEETLVDSAERARIESHLLALLGLSAAAELVEDRRNDAFAGWRRFLEALAEQRPLVLVFEDLHWADESLLDFVDELVEWLTDVPLLVVCTARPELLERRPAWAGGKLNATTLAVQPLSDEQTAFLLGQLLRKPLLEAGSQQRLLERAGGNPLYAEQFVDLFLEIGSTDELPLPETLQGVIAARLDGLREPEKRLLQDAAIVGKVFWASTVAAGSQDVDSVLHSLERKGFVRRQRRSSLEGESEFAFAHALVRDVAYGQIARADRAEKHRRVAEWIDALGRPDDHAEMLAHHWRSALELTRAAGGDEAGIVDSARLALSRAGDRAFGLNSFAAAERYYEAALELWPLADPERPDLLFRRAEALHVAGDDQREQILAEARDALLAIGDRERAAETEAFLASAAWYEGRGKDAFRHLDRAEELVGVAPSAAKARVLAFSGRVRGLSGEHEEGARLAQDALAIAEELGLDELRAHALTTIGTSKHFRDDATGTSDLENALEIAHAIDSPIAGRILNNLGVVSSEAGDLAHADELYLETLRVAERFGDRQTHRFTQANRIWIAFMLGRFDEVREDADRFIAECEAGSPHVQEFMARLWRGNVRRWRGDFGGALDDHSRTLALAREAGDPRSVIAALATLAETRMERGEVDDARSLVQELLPILRAHPEDFGPLYALSPYLEVLAVVDDARAVLEDAPEGHLKEGLELILRGDLLAAAELFGRLGWPTNEARLRFHAGERLVQEGRRREGEVQLRAALAFFEPLEAVFFVERGEALLAKTA